MIFKETPIKDLYVAQSQMRGDERGSFMRLYCAPSTTGAGIAERTPVQINHSITTMKGTIRGLHFQRVPSLESKMVRCIKGRVLDVAVDMRSTSPTYLQHFAIELAAGDGQALMIPGGFAHGFQTLEDNSELIYLHGAAYDAAAEGGLPYNDPTLNIQWPLDVTVLSDRDKSFKALTPDFKGADHAL